MGLFGNKNNKEVYDIDASVEDRYEISSEEAEKVISVLEQIKEQVNEKNLEKAKVMSTDEIKKLIDSLNDNIKLSVVRFGFKGKINEYTHYEYSILQIMAAKRSGIDVHTLKPNKIKPGKGDPKDYGTEAYFKDNIHKVALKDICQLFFDSRIDYSKIDV